MKILNSVYQLQGLGNTKYEYIKTMNGKDGVSDRVCAAILFH